jgi:hypothetical protein
LKETNDYRDVPVRKVLRFIPSVGLIKAYVRRGSMIDREGRSARAGSNLAHPHTYAYIHGARGSIAVKALCYK